jgi:hypothetical protein
MFIFHTAVASRIITKQVAANFVSFTENVVTFQKSSYSAETAVRQFYFFFHSLPILLQALPNLESENMLSNYGLKKPGQLIL